MAHLPAGAERDSWLALAGNVHRLRHNPGSGCVTENQTTIYWQADPADFDRLPDDEKSDR